MSALLIYGANGYTGGLIAGLAGEYGIKPILAGRDAVAVAALAESLGLERRAFAVSDAAKHLHGVSVVLNCAGPFSITYAPMVRACIERRIHYLDITGEIGVLEGIAAFDADARKAGVMLLPGSGFDVVPTDCLAAHVAQRLPGAKCLFLGISGTGRLSRGTMTTALEKSGAGGQVRRGGRIISVPAAWRTRNIDFGNGVRSAVTIPWGDVATAFHSTGIPDIEVYASVPRGTRVAMRASRWLGWLLQRDAVRTRLQQRIRNAPAGPSERELAEGESRVWARAENDSGGAVESIMKGPNGYLLTAHSALLAARRVLAGDITIGFQTPSRAFGADFALEIPGTMRWDVSRRSR
ncbi:MAG: saccharopine dehydrogenase NADP-binding domain-containing protein [Longimicrobiales bacterium]